MYNILSMQLYFIFAANELEIIIAFILSKTFIFNIHSSFYPKSLHLECSFRSPSFCLLGDRKGKSRNAHLLPPYLKLVSVRLDCFWFEQGLVDWFICTWLCIVSVHASLVPFEIHKFTYFLIQDNLYGSYETCVVVCMFWKCLFLTLNESI